MRKTFKIMAFILLGLATIPLEAWGADQGAAKAIIVKGTVSALINGKVVPVKKGDWIPEGADVKTEEKSFTKLIFIDKSTMNVGPGSQMKIDSFPKSEPGVITLVKGQVRSKVTKNYMDMNDKEKSKLFIKTKTAAMGVRGTDFQVSFNPINSATSLVTFEGAVAMAMLVDNLPPRGMQRMLEKVVSSDTAVMVRRGQYSGASPQMKRATIPIKISPVQLETLEKNDTPGVSENSSADNKPKKNFRSVVPPGMDSKQVANDASNVDKAMSDTVGSKTVKVVAKQVQVELGTQKGAPPPEGSVNVVTGAIAPTAGGFVDLNTAQYVPPPPGSTFDANAGVYVPPPEVGYVDPATGSFKNDFYELQPDGSFTEKPPEVAGGSTTSDGGRTPASAGTGSDSSGTKPAGAPPPPPPTVTILPTISEGNLPLPDMGLALNGPPPPGTGGGPEGGPNAPGGEGGFDPTLAVNDDGSSALGGGINLDNNLGDNVGGNDDILLNLRNNGLDTTGTTNVNFDITIQ